MYSSLTWMNAAPPGFQSVHLVTRTPRFDLARTRSILDQFTKFKCPHIRGNLYYFFTILLCCCCIPIKRNRAFTQHRILTVAHRGSICTTVKIKSSMTTALRAKKIHTTCQSYDQCSPQKTLVSTLFLGLTIVHLRQLIWGLNAFGKHLPESPVP